LPCSSPPAALPPTEPDTLSLHDALPIFSLGESAERVVADEPARPPQLVHDFVAGVDAVGAADAFHLQAVPDIDPGRTDRNAAEADRKSTRLNSSHVKISYAVFCLKKKTK